MSVETDVVTALLANSPIAAAIGTRLYPVNVPQHADTYPRASYFVVDQTPIAGRLFETRIQLDWYDTAPVAVAASASTGHGYAVLKGIRDALIDLVWTKPHWRLEIGPDIAEDAPGVIRLSVDLLIYQQE